MNPHIRVSSTPCLIRRIAGFGLGLSLGLHAVELKYSLAPDTGNFQFGSAFTGLGDLDGDGIADFAVADRAYRSGGSSNSGIVLVISGADGSLIRSHLGAPAASQQFGAALAALDVDGDGVLDLAVGSPGASGAGAVWIYSGGDGSLLSQTPGLSGQQYGAALAAAGDQDGDGIPDLFVGAPGANGTRGAVIAQSGIGGEPLWTVNSTVSRSAFGIALSALADLDGDGRPELAAGAPDENNGFTLAGRLGIYRSSDQTLITQRTGSAIYQGLARSLASVADANDDGIPDLLVGSFSGGTCLGVSGSDLSTIADLSIPALPAFQPLSVGGSIGVDGDFIADWLIGSPGLNSQGDIPFGGFRVLSGADGSILFESAATEAISDLGVSLAILPGIGFAAGEISLRDPASTGRGFARVYDVPVFEPAPEEEEEEDPPVLDSDGDGVPDDVDSFPASILTPKVLFFGLDSGVTNRVDKTGASLADRFSTLSEPESSADKGRYISQLTRLVIELRITGRISTKEALKLLANGVKGAVKLKTKTAATRGGR